MNLQDYSGFSTLAISITFWLLQSLKLPSVEMANPLQGTVESLSPDYFFTKQGMLIESASIFLKLSPFKMYQPNNHQDLLCCVPMMHPQQADIQSPST